MSLDAGATIAEKHTPLKNGNGATAVNPFTNPSPTL
jgi:hypothetical protein